MLKAKPYSKSEMPEFLPLSEMAFDSSTHELYVGMGENEPIMKVTDSTLDGSPIDYFGNAYKSLKERMDSDVEHLINGFSLVEYTGSHITATNTFAKQVKNAVLKGRTLVNCIQEPSSKDVVLPYSFTDGQYVTINDTKESGALGLELKGQTLVNCLSGSYSKIISVYNGSINVTDDGAVTITSLTDKFMNFELVDLSLFKPNTKYLSILYVTENTLNGNFRCDTNSSNIFSTGSVTFCSKKEIGIIKTIHTSLDFTNPTIRIKIDSTTAGEKITFKHLILEYQQGMENWDIPYFEGMKSVKAPTVKAVGKNLIIKPQYGYISNGVINTSIKAWINSDYVYVKGLKEIVGSTSSDITGATNIITYDKNKQLLRSLNGQYKATLNDDEYYVVFSRRKLDNTEITPEELLNSQMQLEKGTQATTYEPCKSSSLTLPEEVILRSLPNGVCDTYNTRTGEYIQRIDEKTLEELSHIVSFSAIAWGSGNSHGAYQLLNIAQHIDVKCGAVQTQNMWSDNYAWSNAWHGGSVNNPNDKLPDVFLAFSNDGHLRLMVRKTLIKPDSPQEVNHVNIMNWGRQNAILSTRIQYQLKTPIITKIPLQSILKSWNTTTHIYSEIPENSLYPILSQSNPTYPVMLKPNTKYSIIADSSSNGHTNSAIKFDLGGASASTTVGSRVTTITTPSTLNNNLLTMSGCGNKLKNVMVIEGEIVDNVPYFEGMKSVKSPVLISMGESIIDKKMLKKNQFVNTKNGVVYNTNGFARTSDITIEKGKEYFIKFNTKDFDKAFVNIIEYGDGFLRTLTFHSAGVYRATSDCKYIRVSTSRLMTESLTDEVLEKFQLIITDKSNILSTPEDVELRGIGNTQDTLDLNTGEKVERIGEMILNGNEKWATYSGGGEKEKTVAFRIPSSSHIHSWGDGLGACDKLPFVNGDTIFSKDIEGITSDANGFIIRISKKKCTDLQSLKVYLLSNPIKIQYRLKTPIIKTVDLKGQKLYSYDGITHYMCDSEDGSLLPTAQMLVPTKISAFRGELASNLANANVQSKENAHELEVVKESISQGDLELLANDFDLDFRLFEVELNLSVELYSQAKSDSKIYSTAKSLIVGNYYDKDSMTNRLALLLKHGRITVEQHNELLSLMKGDNEHESD